MDGILSHGKVAAMKFLQDSYNGLYKVLLKPYMPRWVTVLTLILGVIVGLVWGYAISPVVYYDADPRTLEQSWQDEWVKLLADRYVSANADVSANIVDLLTRVDDPVGIVDRLLTTPGEEVNYAKLQALRPLAEAAQSNAVTAPEPSIVGSVVPFILAPLITAIAGIIIAILWGMFVKPNVWDPLQRRISGEKVSEDVKAMRVQVQAIKAAEQTQRTDFATTNLGKPLMQRMSTYLLGHGQYDDSFSIEDENERFLGECGAGISEIIGVGEPQKATAIEVWLFDKDDFVRTITKVFVSEHAFNDPGFRAKLEPKGDLVLVQPGATVTLETASLRLQARVVDLEYGTGPLPPRSYLQKLTLELAAWRKDGNGVMVSAGTPEIVQVPASAPPAPAPVYVPPPAPAPVMTPMPPAPASGGGMFAPPPAPPPTSPPPTLRDDDDPFGGTGDFTPLR